MKYVYIPVDNRPCNNLFPSQLAKLQDVDIVMPDVQILDDFTTPTDHDKLSEWLFNTCTNDTVLVLSVDNLVFGSLLESRKNEVTIDEAVKRMQQIKLLKEKFPNIKIYAFSVLMRTSISTFTTEGIKNWKLVNEYSQLVHKIDLEKKKQDIDRLAQLQDEIPSDILETFLYSRKRNHTINAMSVEYVNDGIFENLSILQEDSTEFGVHKKEQSDIAKLIHKYSLESKVHIHNGTDEAGALTVAKAITDFKPLKTKLSYVYLNDNRDTFMASYEDRLFHENLLSHCETAGIELFDDTSSENILVIYTPMGKQYEASMGEGTPPCDYTASQLNGFGKTVAQLVADDKRVYFLDVAYANGGQGEILRCINKYTSAAKLHGYSAWNTASNSLGTILAQIILSQNANCDKNAAFTMERLLDDFAYQGVVRFRLKTVLMAIGEDPLLLKDKASADKKLQELMEEFVKNEAIFKDEKIKFTCELPWPRIFEAKILL